MKSVFKKGIKAMRDSNVPRVIYRVRRIHDAAKGLRRAYTRLWILCISGVLSLALLATPAAAGGVGHSHAPSVIIKDSGYTFPITSVGQTSGVCSNVCHCSNANNCTCDQSGTIQLNHDVSAPFSAFNYRVQDAGNFDDCSGGSPVTLPVFLNTGQKLSYAIEFSPTRPGTFSDYLQWNNFIFSLSGSTPQGSSSLVPYTPSGWSAPVVVSDTKGIPTDSPTLTSNEPLYVSWAFKNAGDLSTFGTFYIDLDLDGSRLQRWHWDDPLVPGIGLYVQDYQFGPLAPGTHTLVLVPDSTHVTLGSRENYTKTFDVTQPAATLRLVATSINLPPVQTSYAGCPQISGNPAEHGARRLDVTSGSAALAVSVGEGVKLKIVQVNPDGSDGPAANATFTLAGQTPAPPPVPSVLVKQSPPLFDGNVLLSFSEEPDRFMAVHSGTASIAVTTPLGSVSLSVQVASSGYKLGTTNQIDLEGNNIDDPISLYADLRGLPPQIVKSVIGREASGLEENAYRYEPLSIDYPMVSTKLCDTQRNPCNLDDLRNTSQYDPYRVETSRHGDSVDGHLAAGTGLLPVEETLRERYSITADANEHPLDSLIVRIPKGTHRRHILGSDGPISMENILYTNLRQRWINVSPLAEQDFRQQRSANALEPFTAQTVIAASYGMMQVLLTTAYDNHYRTATDDVVGQPSGLFDLTTNIDVGTAVLASKYTATGAAGSFAHFGDLSRTWCQALVRYNGAGASARQYGVSVFKASDTYYPLQ